MDVERIVDSVVARFIGTKHERDIKVIQPIVAEINAREAGMQKLSNAELAAYTPKLKAEVQGRLEGVEDSARAGIQVWQESRLRPPGPCRDRSVSRQKPSPAILSGGAEKPGGGS